MVRDDVYVCIVGDGPERQRLTRFRDQVRIPDRVRFLGPRSDVRDLMYSADVYWSCSEREDVPLALLEAAACGVPCVLSDIRAHRAVLSPTDPTPFFPLGDRATLARLTLQQLDAVPRRGPAMSGPSAAGYPATIASRWTDYAALYRELAGGAR